MPKGESHGKLYLRTLELLLNRPKEISLQDISADTGLPRGWLLSIIAKPHLSPSVDRIVRLYEYLRGEPLHLPDLPKPPKLDVQKYIERKNNIPAPSADRICELCKQPSARALCRDHCHKTLKYRGRICNRCNSGLGFLQDNPALLRAAADYLEKYIPKD